MTNRNLVIIVIIAIIAVVGGYFAYRWILPPRISAPTNESQQNVFDETTPGLVISPNNSQTHEIILTNQGFSPAELTIKVGDTVTFKNESSQGMWIGSAMHPTHAVYAGTTLDQHCPDQKNEAFDECRSTDPGSSWSFTFAKIGSWGYHNHVNASQFGKIIVEQ